VKGQPLRGRLYSPIRGGVYVCKDSAAPALARTRAHRPAAPRQSSGVSGGGGGGGGGGGQ